MLSGLFVPQLPIAVHERQTPQKCPQWNNSCLSEERNVIVHDFRGVARAGECSRRSKFFGGHNGGIIFWISQGKMDAANESSTVVDDGLPVVSASSSLSLPVGSGGRPLVDRLVSFVLDHGDSLTSIPLPVQTRSFMMENKQFRSLKKVFEELVGELEKEKSDLLKEKSELQMKLENEKSRAADEVGRGKE